MPGPLSAPNGNGHLCNRSPQDSARINTGKTALKKKQIERHEIISIRKQQKMSRARLERENES